MSKANPKPLKSVNAYSALALVYDMVMDHVDYEGWADYILHIVELNAEVDDHAKTRILELGCGTGLFTVELLEQTSATIVAADGSASMLEWAEKRLKEDKKRVSLAQFDFESGWDSQSGAEPFDIVLLLYDCINYIQTPEGLSALFAGVKANMKPDSVFVFDQSTPANSINNAAFFEDEGEQDGISYSRKSSFDPGVRVHTTQFEIATPDGVFHENHVQKAWTKEEIQGAIQTAGLTVIKAYDGFSLDEAIDESERIHWVVKVAQ